MRTIDELAAGVALCAAFASAPVIASASAAAAYVCERPGGRVYADRPCDAGPRSAPVPLPAPNGYAAPAVDRVPPLPVRPGKGDAKRAPRAAAPRARGLDAGDPDAATARAEARCRTLERRLDRVEARLRAGYTPAEGERLKEQRRELREDRRWYSCGREAR